MRGRLPPLDYETVAREAIAAEVGGEPAPEAMDALLAGLASSLFTVS